MSLSKSEKQKRQTRARVRAYRERKAEAAAQRAAVSRAIEEAKRETEARRQREAEVARRQYEEANRRCQTCSARPPVEPREWAGNWYCLACAPRCQYPGCEELMTVQRTNKPGRCWRHMDTPLPSIPEPTLPPVRRRDPRLFTPSRRDPFRPAWWDVVDPNPEPIRLAVNPRSALHYTAAPEGHTTVPPDGDLGITFSEERGHVDENLRAEQIKQIQDAQARRR